MEYKLKPCQFCEYAGEEKIETEEQLENKIAELQKTPFVQELIKLGMDATMERFHETYGVSAERMKELAKADREGRIEIKRI